MNARQVGTSLRKTRLDRHLQRQKALPGRSANTSDGRRLESLSYPRGTTESKLGVIDTSRTMQTCRQSSIDIASKPGLFDLIATGVIAEIGAMASPPRAWN